MNSILLSPFALIIFVITIIISLYALFFDNRLLNSFILRPYYLFREKKYYTLITSGFIHADLNHLIFNMLTFFFFAFYLENYIGHWQFVILYFVSMIVSDLPSVFKNKDNEVYGSLGASGAISAVVFSFILYNPFSKIYIMFIPIGIPAILYAFCYLAYCIYASKKQYNNVNHSAHFWGAISGVVLTIILDPRSIFIFLQKFNINL
ncbi:MAG: rhomboid family intramembrane serine protease [Spirochaetes bacterium GWD1_27_9]|nr:MAG: rhomboid family intramembrane serine protease [Spirochaetes bacterium GWC1_27_15]OHD42136.1 MAG: rhomboid family intramembrane serine protease [Spirochaetes bacterium GWD1_27_9]